MRVWLKLYINCLIPAVVKATMTKRRTTRSTSNTPAKKTKVDMDALAVNTIRALSADQPFAANSGHPGP